MEVLGFEHNLLADALQDLLRGIVESAADEEGVADGFKMNVVTCHARFLPFGADVDAVPVLVGTLVLRETDVAVDAIDAVLDLQASTTRVEGGNAGNELLGNGGHCLFGCLIFVTVSIEPGFVIILPQSQVEVEKFFHIH